MFFDSAVMRMDGAAFIGSEVLVLFIFCKKKLRIFKTAGADCIERFDRRDCSCAGLGRWRDQGTGLRMWGHCLVDVIICSMSRRDLKMER